MIQENLTPKEALERAKLLMRYDTRKTLTENQESQKPLNEIAPVIAAVAAAPWLYGAGATAVAAISKWIYDANASSSSWGKITTFFQGCSAVMSKLKPTSGVNHREAADSIYTAVDGLTTDEDAVKEAIASMKTPADLCELQRVYDLKYGNFLDDLDGDFDGSEITTYIWAPMADIIDSNPVPTTTTTPPVQTTEERQRNINSIWCAVKNGVIYAENSKVNGMEWADYVAKYNVTSAEIATAKAATCPKKSEEKDRDRDEDRDKDKKKKTSTNWKTDCSPNYVKGCKSDKIAEAQKCLGLTADGKFGPKTQNKLAQKGFPNGFTDSDIPQICGTNTTNTKTENPDVKVDDPNADF